MFLFDNNEIIRRLKKYPILEHFSKFALRKLVSLSETLELADNEVLFYHDEPSDSVYYLIEGHLEGFSSDSFDQKIVDINRGEMIGEMGVVAEESRGLSVRASRVSQVLKIKKEVFLNFFQKKPELLMILAQTMAKRLRHVIMNLRDTSYPYKNIGLLALSEGISLSEIKMTVQKHAPMDRVSVYEQADFNATKLEMVPFFCQCEDNEGINLFLANYGEENWSNAIMDHVDYIYLAVREGEWMLLTSEKVAALRKKPSDIVIMHSKKGPYKDTVQFYNKYAFKRHHHLMETQADYQRLYRYMTGQAIGLVLSGGGFRGYAHSGLVKALLEAKIPVDCIGGSSIGAGIGGILSLHHDNWDGFEQTLNHAMSALKNTRLFKFLTLPVISVLSGKLVTDVIQETFRNYQIEDLPINFFCVVGNLSKTQKEIQKIGALWEWIRASVAIPGVIPPVEKEGSVYVDGGVCANLPVRDMRDYLNQAGKIIAFDVRLHPFRQKKYCFPPVLSLKDVLGYKFGLNKHHYILPNLTEIIMEASFISQSIEDIQGRGQAEIILAPDTSAFHAYDAKKSQSLNMFAYEFAQEKLKEYKIAYERWII